MRLSILPTSLALAMSLAVATPALAADRVEVLAVTASSTDGMLMDAIDDDVSTAWRNKRDGEREAWLAVRFEEPAKLRGVRLNVGALPSDVTFDVEGSVDGVGYQTLLKGQYSPQDKTLELNFPRKATALYLRVRFTYTGSGLAPRYQVRELEALSDS
jgi:hypothetical protein